MIPLSVGLIHPNYKPIFLLTCVSTFSNTLNIAKQTHIHTVSTNMSTPDNHQHRLTHTYVVGLFYRLSFIAFNLFLQPKPNHYRFIHNPNLSSMHTLVPYGIHELKKQLSSWGPEMGPLKVQSAPKMCFFFKKKAITMYQIQEHTKIYTNLLDYP